MAQNFLEVDTGTLGQCAASVREEINDLKANFNALISGVTSLDAMWEGGAHSAFKSQFVKDQETYESFCQALEQYAACLEDAVKEYNNCESSVRGVVDAIRVG